VFSSVAIVGAFSILFAMLWPALLPLWIGYLTITVLLWLIYFIAYNRSVETEHKTLNTFLIAQQQWLRQHTLWPLTSQKNPIDLLQKEANNALRARLHQNKLSAYFEHFLLLLSLGTMLIIPWVNLSDASKSAFVVLPFFIFISVKDWLLPMINGLNQAVLKKHKAKTLTKSISITKNKPHQAVALHSPTQQVNTFALDAFCWQRSNIIGIALTTEFKEPGVYLFEGATGLGKSSTFEALSGELPYQGRLIVNGVDLDKAHAEDRRRLFHHAQQFGHIFSDSLHQNLLIANPKANVQAIQDALIWAELPQWANEDDLNRWLGPQGIPISGGEQKRLLLARAYLSDAPIWLLDEPFEGLDEATVNALVTKINIAAQQKFIIIASHVFPASLKTTDTLKIS
jgi:ATP-binding cassette subfamily C protein CydC